MPDNEKRLTEHFLLREFFCHCGKCEPTEEIIQQLQIRAEQLEILRTQLTEPIHILSGYRCKEHNKKVGGAKNSQHLLGTASDITAKNHTPKQIYKIIKELIEDGKLLEGGLGLYPNFVHIDHRGYKARWNEV